MDPQQFLHDAFSRNRGIISAAGQEKLLHSRVAVAGAGGVGGLHLLTLARLGVGCFSIADLDVFEVVNINRQFGAMVSTIGQEKATVLAGMVKDINPYSDIRIFGNGVTEANLDDFLDGVDIYVDGIDFFEIGIRRAVFRRCRERKIFALTAAPLGFGATLQVFAPDGMSFDDYFGIRDEMPLNEQIAAFAAGLAPHPYHIKYLDLSEVSMARKKGPAVAIACTQASSFIANEVVKILTGIGRVRPVPHYLQLDLLRNKYTQGYLFMGGRNPLQILKRKIILKKFGASR